MTEKTHTDAELAELKANYEKEIERVKGITSEFFAKYGELCKEYKAQIVPKIISMPNNPTGFNLQLFLAPYSPLENEKENDGKN